MWSYAWKEVRRRHARSALTVGTIAVTVLLLVAVWGVLRVLGAGVNQVFEASASDMTVQTMDEPGPYRRARLARHLGRLPDGLAAQIAALPGVKAASGQLHFWSWKEEEQLMSAVAGLAPDQAATIGPLATGVKLVNGRLLWAGDAGVAVIDSHYGDKWKVGVSDHIDLSGRTFEVIGVVMPDALRAAQAEVYIPLADAQTIMMAEQPAVVRVPVVNTVLVRVADLAALGRLEQQIRQATSAAAKAAGLPARKVMVNTASRVFEQATGVSVLARRAAQAIALLVVAGMVLIVLRSAVGAVVERRAEIGVLQACGWTHRDVARLLAQELFIQGLIGALIGAVSGELIVYAWSRAAVVTIPNAMNPFPCLPSIPMPTQLAPPFVAAPLTTLAIVLGAIAVCLVGALVASRKATKLEPIEALRRL